MKQILYISILLCSLSGIAQEHILTIDNDWATGNKSAENSFLIKNLSENYFGVFLEDNTLINGYFFDLDLSPIAKISSEKISKKYKTLLGYTLGEKSIRLFFTNASSKKIISVLFDFQNQITTTKEYKINLKETNYLTSHNESGNLYFISLIRGKSSLRVINFHHSGSFETTDVETYTKELKNEWLYDNAGDDARDFKPFFVKIDKEKPHRIGNLVTQYKTYKRKEGFAFLLSNSENFTYLINITTSNLKADVQRFENVSLDEGKKSASTSFLLEDNLFQISVVKKEVNISIRDLSNLGDIVKSHTWSLDELLEIKNSEIRTSDTFPYSFYNEKLKMKMLLKLMSKNKIGLSVIKNSNDYLLTLGSVFDINTSGPNASAGGSVALGASAAYSYDIEFDLILDKDLNHKVEKTHSNIFQKIREHKKKIALPRANLIDELNGHYIYGNYNIGNHKYYMFKFEKY